MPRKFSWTCPACGKKSLQDWEDPDECPYCDGEEHDEDDYDPPDYDPPDIPEGYDGT